MSIIRSIPPPKKWNHRHIILVTLIGCLVVNAITAAISISLSPAHIFFSIRNPSGNQTGAADDDTMLYNFTLVARNTSPRMAVHYVSLSAEIWYSATTWVPAMVDWQSALQEEDGTMHQPPGTVANISVSAEYWQSEQKSTPPPPPPPPPTPPPPPATADGSGGNDQTPAPTAAAVNKTMDWSSCTVLVTANVWFKSRWWIGTRAYDVRANCSQVNFGNHSAIVDCK